MLLNRRQFGATAIGSMTALWAAPSIAQGKKVNLKVGGQFADSHPSSKAMEEACADIRKQSDGRIDIQFFPNAQLGSDAAMLTQIRSGALDMMTASGISMQVVSPVAGISGMAFAFSDYAHVWQAMDGDLGASIREASTRSVSMPSRRSSTVAIATSPPATTPSTRLTISRA